MRSGAVAETMLPARRRKCRIDTLALARHFPTNQSVIEMAAPAHALRLAPRRRGRPPIAGPPVEKIERIVRHTLAYFWDRRFCSGLIHPHEPRRDGEREWLRHRAQLSRLVQETLEEAIAAGHVRQVSARIAAEMLLSMMHSANRYRMRGDRLEDLAAAVIDVFMRGVATPAGRRVLGRRRP